MPDYQSIMLPLLKLVSDGRERSLREAIDTLADTFGLSEEERKKLLPSGLQSIFDNRVGWARTYLKKAGLVGTTKRGSFRITERGLQLLAENPAHIDNKLLMRYAEFREFKTRPARAKEPVSPAGTEQTPRESLETSYQQLREGLAEDLLNQVKSCSPRFFENLVVDLLVKMGYGGSREDAGQATRMTGDEGIDGIIKEDRLGLDAVYLQAKRWEGPVSRPEVQKFAGALQGHRARKGVFITTSRFSRDAVEFANNIDNKIVLIDGEELAQLMIDFDIGVSTLATYEVKKMDTDYFSEE